MNICVGDRVKVVCKDRTLIKDEYVEKVFTGYVESLFNAIDKDGSDKWIYEIRGEHTGWFLYKPYIDGGTITLLKEKK